ncbi:MAG: tetratricopeptide repeat protein, partial [Nanoarchaeota archaeon]|nr:tetratricopeptide repeat protein [Nanoarchaeota archaeon]
YVSISWMHYLIRRYEEAEAFATKALELNPQNERAYLHLGLISRNQGNFDRAESMFQEVIIINPENSYALFELGLLYHTNNMTEEANDMFSKMLALAEENITDPDVYITMGQDNYYNLRFKESELAFKRGIALDPDNYGAYQAMSIFYFTRHQIPDQEVMLLKALSLNPDSPGALGPLGLLYSEEGMHDKAIPVLERGLKHYTDMDGLKRLAMAYKQMNRSDDAYNTLVRLLEEDSSPERTWEYSEIAYYWLTHGEEERAQDMFDKFEDYNLGNAIKLYNSVGQRYQEKGLVEEAKRYFERAKEISKDFRLPAVQENYLKLYSIVEDREIKLFAVQYPTLDVRDLESFFVGDENIVFVDNNGNFERALATHDYYDIFEDRNHGTWGHGTALGNSIIAEAVADTILAAQD